MAPDRHDGQRRPITRRRELLACIECRRRKLKCDRSTPCSCCVKRDIDCVFADRRSERGEHGSKRRLDAEGRLNHLEELVQQLAASQHAPIAGASHAKSAHPGHDVPLSEPLYTGSTHWTAMLADIEELRLSMTREVPPDRIVALPESRDGDSISLLFGHAASLSMQHVLDQYLPDRREADRLIAAYFRSGSMVAPFMHAPHFQRQYQNFWINPQAFAPLWVSLMFSVLHIASSVVSPSQPFEGSQRIYSVAAAQSLAVGKYYRPQPYAVEALLLFTQSQCFGSFDVTPDFGILMGNVVRLAVSSGYHRDPETADISAFEKEMRRRGWSLVVQLDLLLSFALGLPANLPFANHDTKIPRNLQDSDFDEHTSELPPGRSEAEATGIQFYIAKHKLMAVFEKVLWHALRPFTGSDEHLDKLEAELTTTYFDLPDTLRPRPIANSIVDAPQLVITRLCTSFLYQKSRCVLHRKHAAGGRDPSSAICYEASRAIVEPFIDIFADLQPGGQFEKEQWFNSSLTWHDFLLGITVLCLVLCIGRSGRQQLVIDYAGSLELLRKARDVMSQVSYRSRSTKRVQGLIDATAHRFECGHPFLSVANTRADPNEPQLSNDATELTYGSHPMDMATTIPDSWDTDWGVASSALIDDVSWSFMEQFLNIPAEEYSAKP